MSEFLGPGFTATDPLSITTRGVLDTGLHYEVDLDPHAIDTTRTTQEVAEAALGRRWGVDLSFPGDFEVMPNGDLALTNGLEGVRAALTRAIITAPAELFWRPDYGIGATEFLNRQPSSATMNSLQNRVRSTLLQHAAVDEVKRCEVVSQGDALLEVNVELVLVGHLQPLAIQIRRE